MTDDKLNLDQITVDELAGILRVGHRAIITEADEWRPLAKYVLDFAKLAVKEALEQKEVEQATCCYENELRAEKAEAERDSWKKAHGVKVQMYQFACRERDAAQAEAARMREAARDVVDDAEPDPAYPDNQFVQTGNIEALRAALTPTPKKEAP